MTTSSENLASLEPWAFRPSFADSWISEVFTRDTETLTKALQKSLSCDSETLADTKNSSFHHLIKPEQTPTSSVSDPDNNTSKRRNHISNGKISKRKSRATKRSPTTFITADPSNFRQMVQQVTGIQFSNSHVPVAPVPHRLGNRIQNCCLPTLDTSAFLLANHQPNMAEPTVNPQGHVSFVPAAEGGVGLDFDALQSFPTLESWRVM